jgi:putative membrane protein
MRVPDGLKRASTALALALGLALGGVLVARVGVGRVWHLFTHARWYLCAVLPLHFVQIALTAAAWRSVTGPGAPGIFVFIVARWLREGVNSLLPVLPVAGLLASIRVLTRRGLALPRAVAATITDTTVELVAQIPFTVLGLALLVAAQGAGAVSIWMGVALLVLCLLGAFLVPAQRLGLARIAERSARRLGWAGRIDGLDEALRRIQGRRRRLGFAAMRHLTAWLLGGLEVWLALAALGHPIRPGPALVIESLGYAIRGAAFLVPGALGVQEGGFILVCSLFGVPPALGLTLSLVKRLRDLAFGAPSLAIWARMERRGGVAPGVAGAGHSAAWPHPGTQSG